MSALRERMSPAVAWSALGAGVVLMFLVVGVVLRAVAPAPSGPALSSYSTTAHGLAAWAELLQRDGHVVRQIRQPLGSVRLPGDATLVVLGPTTELSRGEAQAISRFVQRGGWLVVSGAARAHAGDVRGRVIVVPDSRFLQNDAIARGENAFRALAVAGPPHRPVLFDEAIHGYGPATGLAALPERWWFALGLLALALAAFALSRAMRLGGADPVAPEPPSPRTAYVEAMAETLVRTTAHADLVRRVGEAASTEARFRGSL